MLSKLLKYELRASGRILLPVYALLLASAGCCSLFYKLAADHPYRTGAASVLMGLLNVAFWIFVVATGAITALLMIYRFYKNYMTDEGYLMFTLPVNRHQLIWSKLLSALLYTAASAVAVTLSILLVLLPIADWSGFWGNLGELLSSITESLHFGVPGPLLLLWIAVLAILTVFSGFLMVYAAIALGHSFSNHKDPAVGGVLHRLLAGHAGGGVDLLLLSADHRRDRHRERRQRRLPSGRHSVPGHRFHRDAGGLRRVLHADVVQSAKAPEPPVRLVSGQDAKSARTASPCGLIRFHSCGIPKNRTPFSHVWRSTCSAGNPFSWAIFSATRCTYPESLRFPRKGTGVR